MKIFHFAAAALGLSLVVNQATAVNLSEDFAQLEVKIDTEPVEEKKVDSNLKRIHHLIDLFYGFAEGGRPIQDWENAEMEGRIKATKGTPLNKEIAHYMRERAFERAEATHKKPTKEEFPPMGTKYRSIEFDYDQGHR